MNIVVTSATVHESRQIREIIEPLYNSSTNFNVTFHTCGVGILASTFSIFKGIN